MLTRLKDHAEYYIANIGGFREEFAPMVEAVTHVSHQNYPVELFGQTVGFISFRITTSRTGSFLDGDWAIQFFWSPEKKYFHFSIWRWTPRGELAMPQRACDRSDFGGAIDELVEQMTDGSLDFDS